MRRGAGFGAVLLALAQLLRPPLTNPPVTGDVQAPPAVQTILRKACYDCHSNETVWPWYAHVVPSSWLLWQDVQEGREDLDFSAWTAYSAEERAKRFAQIGHELEEGDMPPLTYRLMHAAARLTPEEIALLQSWAESGSASGGK